LYSLWDTFPQVKEILTSVPIQQNKINVTMEAKKAPSTKNKKDAALEALRESGKTYRSIFEHSSVPMMIIEKDSTISLTNNKFAEMSGFRRTDVGGKKKWMDLVAPQDIEKLTNCFNDMKKTKDGSTRHLIVDFLDRKKAIHRVSLNVTVIPGTSRIIASFDQIRDERLEAGTADLDFMQMAGVINNIPDATFAIDRNGKVIAWNRALEELTGINSFNILGKGGFEYSLPFFHKRRPMIADFIFAPDIAIEKEGYSGIQWTGNSVSAETPASGIDGRFLFIREIASPVFDKQGEVAGAIESIADITSLKHSVMAQQDADLQFRTIIETTASGIAILEEDSTISFINPEFEKIIGYVKEEVEGKKKWTDFVAPENLEKMKDYENKRRADIEVVPANFEFRFIRFDGEARNGFCTITPVPESGKMIVSLIDITDKIQEEYALHRAIKKLNFLNSITRHEILNHLTVVKGFIELSKDQLPNAQFLLRSFDKELRAANDIQNLMIFSRDYQNMGIQPPAWYNVSKTIKSVVDGTQLGSITLSDETQGVEVYADQMIEKVFFHLVDNAVRYGGKITKIRFFCEESFEELHIICEDDGIGIPPDAKKKIFNRQFFQNKGLDMYLSQEIVSITGMSIRETGTYGRGSRFEILVPKGAYRFISPH
jgi:PAS domain S-box-containing protein